MSYISSRPFEDVASRLRRALKTLLRDESDLFTFAVNERTVTQRLSQYLEQAFDELKLGVKADCEYNRMWVESAEGEKNTTKKYQVFKDIIPTVEDTDAKTVFPDIIVHLRGKEYANILVVEAKRDAVRGSIPEPDRIKLFEFTRADGSFRYPWGAFLNFRTFDSQGGLSSAKVTVVDVAWFRSGEKFQDQQVHL
jgi:hypothetical protein